MITSRKSLKLTLNLEAIPSEDVDIRKNFHLFAVSYYKFRQDRLPWLRAVAMLGGRPGAWVDYALQLKQFGSGKELDQAAYWLAQYVLDSRNNHDAITVSFNALKELVVEHKNRVALYYLRRWYADHPGKEASEFYEKTAPFFRDQEMATLSSSQDRSIETAEYVIDDIDTIISSQVEKIKKITLTLDLSDYENEAEAAVYLYDIANAFLNLENEEAAFEWMQAAAELGSEDAILHLANWYRSGSATVAQDVDQAAKMFYHATDFKSYPGVSELMIMAGEKNKNALFYLYQLGYGLTYLYQAAELDQAEAISKLESISTAKAFRILSIYYYKQGDIEKSYQRFVVSEFNDALEGSLEDVLALIQKYNLSDVNDPVLLSNLLCKVINFKDVRQSIYFIQKLKQDHVVDVFYTPNSEGQLPVHCLAKEAFNSAVMKELLTITPYTQLHTKDKNNKRAKDYANKRTEIYKEMKARNRSADLFDYEHYMATRKQGTSNYHERKGTYDALMRYLQEGKFSESISEIISPSIQSTGHSISLFRHVTTERNADILRGLTQGSSDTPTENLKQHYQEFVTVRSGRK